MGTTKQVIDHSDVDTALQITKGDADKFVVGSLISWYDISAGTYSTEKMRVTSIDTSNEGYDILNVTRNADGGGAFDPAIDDLIVPYHPGTDHQGLPISGAKTLEAGVTFTHTALTPVSAAGDDFIYRVKSWEVAYDNTIVPVNEEYGVDHATGYNAGRNASTVTLEAFMHRDLFREYGRARNFKSVGVMIQIGNVQGKCVALWMPRVDFDAQPIEDAANDDIVPTTFTGRMLGTNGADEMFLLFV
ncbi:MAG: hypothetical protein D6816_04700 [Bacteroidetes bacterium]|nr:MAG: hypothetical protein D6816_04700 [Bacteroidota bacterium]